MTITFMNGHIAMIKHLEILVLCTVLFTVVSTSSGEPVQNEPTSQIVDYHYSRKNDGEYEFHFRTSDGTSRNEIGYYSIDQKRTETRRFEYKVVGYYSYEGPDGVIYTVNYTADENGYHPVISSNLPSTARFGTILTGQLPPGVLASLLG